MDPREHLRQALESVTSHPRRLVASSMGVLWGSAAIILMLAWGAGFQEYMHAELERYGKPMVFVIPGVTSSGFPGHRAGVRIRIARSDIEATERGNRDRVEAILAEHLSRERVLVRAGPRVRRLDLAGVGPRFAGYRRFRVGLGRFVDRSDVERARPVAVLGHEAASELFGSPERAIGRRVRVDGHPFEVIGVADPKGRQYINTNRPDNRLLMVPITAAEERLGYREDRLERISVIPTPGTPGEEAVHAVVRSIAERRGFHPDDTDAVRWFDLSQHLRLVDRISLGFLVFIGLAGTVTLLVAAVGIANYHLATLEERAVEIGVAKAIGARGRTLVLQALLESALVSGAASGLGLAIGLLGCLALDRLAPPGLFPTPVIGTAAVAITLGAVTAVSILAALVPAVRVRRMEVAVALRSTP